MSDNERATSSTTDRIGIVIVNYRTEARVQTLLAALRGSHRSLPCAVALVSNSGPIDEIAVEHRLDRIISKRNVGFGRACNLGSDAIGRVRYVAFVNPDVVVTFDVISALCDLLDTHPDYGIASPYTSPSSSRFEPTGRLNETGARVNIGSIFVIAADLFKTLGRFDESFFLWFEDADLRDRVLRAGRKVGLADGIIVSHSGGGSYQAIDAATADFLTRTWMTSHAYFRVKWQGSIRAAAWVIGSALWNFAKLVARVKSRRRYVSHSAVVRFAPWLLASVLFKPSRLAFDGRSFDWWPPGR